MTTTSIRSCGALTAVGGVAWGVSWIVAPSRRDANSQIEIWASGLFQLGLIALLAVMWASHATGSSRAARSILATEVVAVVLAMAWTLPYLFDANRPSTGVLLVLDTFWPLSMAGFIVVSFMVAGAHHWPRPLRHLPLAASLLIVVDLSLAWTPAPVGNTVTGIYLGVTYGLTGLTLTHHAAKLPSQPPGPGPGPGPGW